MDCDSLNRAVEIIPDQRRDVVVSVGSSKRIAYGGFANSLDVGRCQAREALDDTIYRDVQIDSSKVLLQQALPVGGSRRTNFDFF